MFFVNYHHYRKTILAGAAGETVKCAVLFVIADDYSVLLVDALPVKEQNFSRIETFSRVNIAEEDRTERVVPEPAKKSRMVTESVTRNNWAIKLLGFES